MRQSSITTQLFIHQCTNSRIYIEVCMHRTIVSFTYNYTGKHHFRLYLMQLLYYIITSLYLCYPLLLTIEC